LRFNGRAQSLEDRLEKGEAATMTHTIIMPDLGQTTSEGKILKWLKRPGDKVSRGEHLLEVETDKVTMEVEAYTSGYLREILASEGQMASAMSPIAIVTDTPEEHYERPGEEAPAPTSRVETSTAAPRVASPVTHDLIAAPAAKSLAKELGIDLKAIPGKGPGGWITRKDVEQFAAGQKTSKPMAAMAALVTRSKQTIPHFYLTADVDVSAAERWREQWNAAHPDLSATVNDVFVRAAAKALEEVPSLNVSYRDGRYEQNPAADVVLIVAFESGLALVPVADPTRLSWDEYLQSMRKILERARQGRTTESPSRSTPLLAISNLGMFCVKEFAAIIPPLCTAILAVGAIRDEPVVRNGQVQVGRVATLTLSLDHRVVHGITAAKFMERIQEHLNNS
jgi:pyruvate dehydrogenase E2 component (dihydrolipoamide acetyltransferase)